MAILNIDQLIRRQPHLLLDSPRDTGQLMVAGPKTFRLGCRMVMQSKKKGSKEDKAQGIDPVPFNNFGGNRQNLEKKMRIIWIPDNGYKFVQFDQAGAEALIVAYICKKGKYRELFIHGIKPHCYIALKLFPDIWKQHFDSKDVDVAINTPISELRSLPFWNALDKLIKSSDNWPIRYYYIGKKVVHASSYGMRGYKMATVMLKETEGAFVIDGKAADDYILAFHDEFPEIGNWHDEVIYKAEHEKQLRNLFGFPFNITKKINKSDFKDLIAWSPQSTVACITRQAYCDLYDYTEANNKQWHQLADTHDSYMSECPIEEELECAKIMKKFIEIELVAPSDGSKFRMRSEGQSGFNWSPFHAKYNPDGLKEFDPQLLAA